jgi:hypothetical protein
LSGISANALKPHRRAKLTSKLDGALFLSTRLAHGRWHTRRRLKSQFTGAEINAGERLGDYRGMLALDAAPERRN